MKIRRFLSVFLLTLLLTGLFCVPQASAVDLPQVNAKAALLMDYESGRMLYGLNERDTEYPASITKVMTALLTLEAVDQGVLTLDQQVAAPSLVNDMDPTGSSADIKEGEVLTVETRELRGGEMQLLSFALTDYTNTIKCKVFLRYKPRKGRFGSASQEDDDRPPTEEEKKAVDDVIAAVKEGKWVAVRGDVKMDSFEHGLVMMVNDIDGREKPMRQDTAERKRIELHMHTNMSEMDAVSSASDLIKRAAQWGHPAVAITDHGVVQAFPEAFGAAKKNKIKLIPGMEGYLTDVTVVVKDGDDRPLTDDIVVVDFETTGLNPRKCRIMEIGAVRIRNGQVVEEYSRFVNPMEPIPQEVSELTHITDAMVADASPAEVEIPKLLEFIGGAAFAAHNAKFDYSFLTEECNRLGIEIHMPVIDTLEFSRRMYPSLKSHRLGAVCKSLGISLKNAHRAVHDARATAHMLNRMLDTVIGIVVALIVNLTMPGPKMLIPVSAAEDMDGPGAAQQSEPPEEKK